MNGIAEPYANIDVQSFLQNVSDYKIISNPYTKVTGYLSVCLYVLPKDLANRSTDIVLLYRVDSHRSREGL